MDFQFDGLDLSESTATFPLHEYMFGRMPDVEVDVAPATEDNAAYQARVLEFDAKDMARQKTEAKGKRQKKKPTKAEAEAEIDEAMTEEGAKRLSDRDRAIFPNTVIVAVRFVKLKNGTVIDELTPEQIVEFVKTLPNTQWQHLRLFSRMPSNFVEPLDPEPTVGKSPTDSDGSTSTAAVSG